MTCSVNLLARVLFAETVASEEDLTLVADVIYNRINHPGFRIKGAQLSSACEVIMQPGAFPYFSTNSKLKNQFSCTTEASKKMLWCREAKALSDGKKLENFDLSPYDALNYSAHWASAWRYADQLINKTYIPKNTDVQGYKTLAAFKITGCFRNSEEVFRTDAHVFCKFKSAN